MQACGAGDDFLPGNRLVGEAVTFPFPGKACGAGGNIPHPGQACGAGDGIPSPGAGGRFPAIHRPQERTPHPSLEWGNVV
ncbi:MAG: hypothetical protein IKB48_04500, partial [Bacteroidales bacterium]|nr:hypothetical protein [Bacteroidales bacterium]